MGKLILKDAAAKENPELLRRRDFLRSAAKCVAGAVAAGALPRLLNAGEVGKVDGYSLDEYCGEQISNDVGKILGLDARTAQDKVKKAELLADYTLKHHTIIRKQITYKEPDTAIQIIDGLNDQLRTFQKHGVDDPLVMKLSDALIHMTFGSQKIFQNRRVSEQTIDNLAPLLKSPNRTFRSRAVSQMGYVSAGCVSYDDRSLANRVVDMIKPIFKEDDAELKVFAALSIGKISFAVADSVDKDIPGYNRYLYKMFGQEEVNAMYVGDNLTLGRYPPELIEHMLEKRKPDSDAKEQKKKPLLVLASAKDDPKRAFANHWYIYRELMDHYDVRAFESANEDDYIKRLRRIHDKEGDFNLAIPGHGYVDFTSLGPGMGEKNKLDNSDTAIIDEMGAMLYPDADVLFISCSTRNGIATNCSKRWKSKKPQVRVNAPKRDTHLQWVIVEDGRMKDAYFQYGVEKSID